MKAIHPVFHTGKLTPYESNEEAHGKVKPPPGPVIPEDNEYEVEEVIDSKFYGKGKKKIKYLVKWKGWPIEESEWMWPQDSFQEAIDDFHKTHPNADKL